MMENFLIQNYSTTILVKKIQSSDKKIIIPIENKFYSNINNNRHENDLDKEVEVTNGQVILFYLFKKKKNLFFYRF